MSEPRLIQLPASRDELATLRAGDDLVLSGPVYTARDATHVMIAAELTRTGELPCGLSGQMLFYAGPTPEKAGRVVGSVGPTTAARMDAFTPELLRAGIVATIGKGMRAEAVRTACMDTGSVYLGAVGGSAALLATHVTGIETIAWPELGTEALVRLDLDRFPVFTAIDVLGGDLYSNAARLWRESVDAL